MIGPATDGSENQGKFCACSRKNGNVNQVQGDQLVEAGLVVIRVPIPK